MPENLFTDISIKSAFISTTYGYEFIIFKGNDCFQCMKIISFSKRFDYTDVSKLQKQ